MEPKGDAADEAASEVEAGETDAPMVDVLAVDDTPEETADPDVADPVTDDDDPEVDDPALASTPVDTSAPADLPLDVPAPVHPQSTDQERRDRAAYERAINDEASAFGEIARQVFIDGKLRGHSVTLIVWDPEDRDADPVIFGELSGRTGRQAGM